MQASMTSTCLTQAPARLLHTTPPEKRVICYVDVGSWESGRPDQLDFDPACWCGATTTVTGTGASAQVTCPSTAHQLSGWPEYYFDVRTNSSCKDNVRTVMAARFALAASNGCDGIEPDNTDAFDNPVGGVQWWWVGHYCRRSTRLRSVGCNHCAHLQYGGFIQKH